MQLEPGTDMFLRSCHNLVSLPSLSNISGSDLAKKLGQADLATLKNAVQTGAGKVPWPFNVGMLECWRGRFHGHSLWSLKRTFNDNIMLLLFFLAERYASRHAGAVQLLLRARKIWIAAPLQVYHLNLKSRESRIKTPGRMRTRNLFLNRQC